MNEVYIYILICIYLELLFSCAQTRYTSEDQNPWTANTKWSLAHSATSLAV